MPKRVVGNKVKSYGFTNFRRTLNGLPVVDAATNKQVHISVKDAENKVGRKEPGDCVLAKTCVRELESPEVLVHRSRAYVQRTKNGKKFWERYLLSTSLRNETTAYDRGGSFEPDDYVLLAPPETHKLGLKRSNSASSKRRGAHHSKGLRHPVKNVRVAAGYK